MENVTETEVGGGNTDSTNSKGAIKTWVFTLNNYTEADCIMFQQWEDKVTRMTVSKEMAETTGTLHLQGAVTFKSTKRLSALKKLHSRVSWAPALAKDCFIYPVKEWSDVFIDINNKTQGRRNDWLEVKNMIKEGKSYRDVAEEHPHLMATCRKGIDYLADCLENPRPIKKQKKGYFADRQVIWIYGPTGTNKTRHIYDKHGYDDVWVSSKNLDWFDGYYGQKIAVFDDFRSNSATFNWLLRLLDKYPLQVPIKCGFVDWTPEIIYITSCKNYDNVYNKENFDNDEKVDQLKRRITEVINKGESEEVTNYIF